MDERKAIRYALESAGLCAEVKSARNLSGGCIHKVMHLTLADGQSLIAKVNESSALSQFSEESHSLERLARTATVLAPTPLAAVAHFGTAVLLMTAIAPLSRTPNQNDWRDFGRQLAALHQAGAGEKYGFDMDNHIGSTLQPNSWHDDWVEFNANNRLGFQLALARDNDHLDAAGVRAIESVINRLDGLIPRKPRPALLHGDLWSGNALPGSDPQGNPCIAVIDPASSIGDGWADIAMMRLFGGFPAACFEGYEEIVDRPDDLESRIAVYQLYHVLNHVNIFGAGYVSQALGLTNRLIGA